MKTFGFSLVALACLALAPALRAEPLPPLPLWPGEAPGMPAEVEPELASPGGGFFRNVSRPLLTVYPAPEGAATGAAVIVCPGGAYAALAYGSEGVEICQWLNSIGVTAILLKYRVSFGRDKALQDAQRALVLVRHHAAQWGIDPKRVGIMGFSAGGHLSAAAGTNFAKRAYPAVDAADGQSCRPDFALLIYPAFLRDPAFNRPANGHLDASRIAPELPLGPQTPPMFLAQAANDSTHVEGTLVFSLALKTAKIPFELHIYPTGGHGYGAKAANPAGREWPQRAEEWLRGMGVLESAGAMEAAVAQWRKGFELKKPAATPNAPK